MVEEVEADLEDEEVVAVAVAETSIKTAGEVDTIIAGTTSSNKATHPSRCSKLRRIIHLTSTSLVAIISKISTRINVEAEVEADLECKVAGTSVTVITTTISPSISEAEGDAKKFLKSLHQKSMPNSA